jgi:hypothetical protein
LAGFFVYLGLYRTRRAADNCVMGPFKRIAAGLIVVLSATLAGCEFDIEKIPGLGPDPVMLAREADARAQGAACRHGLRSIEDCFNLNPRASKAQIFAGWKEMDDYMRTHKIEGQKATIEAPVQPTRPRPASAS